MYTIKNTSSKIIHVGTTILMPDMTMKVADAAAKTPAIKALAKRKMLEVAPIVPAASAEAPKQDEAPEQGEETGEQSAEQSGEQSGEDQAPADTAKGTRRTTRKAASAKE